MKIEKRQAKLQKIANKINELENLQDKVYQLNFANNEESAKIGRKLNKLYIKERKLTL